MHFLTVALFIYFAISLCYLLGCFFVLGCLLCYLVYVFYFKVIISLHSECVAI